MSAILPGATLGVLGGGQLGRMFVQAAQRMGYYTAVLDRDPISPAGSIAHYHIQGDTNDEAALAQLMQRCAAITTEFENVSAAAMATLAAQRVVSPLAQHVAIAQNRIEEKTALSGIAKCNSIPSAAPVPWASIESAADLDTCDTSLFPGVLKTATLGYDGKGQVKVGSREQAKAAYTSLHNVPCILEQWTTLAAECSVVVARGADGQMTSLPTARNTHVHGILASSEVFEGNLPQAVSESAQDAAKLIANSLQYVGVLCVEFFVLPDSTGALSEKSELRVNEIAPRPHNSGHWSMEGSSLSQFELQVRTLCGLPLPEPVQLACCVMLNLLGDVWFDAQGKERTPDWRAVLQMPGVSLHLYGKHQARAGRKMGHITVCGPSPAKVRQTALSVSRVLGLPYVGTHPSV